MTSSNTQVIKKLAIWPVVVNATLFQITWFACALGAAKDLLWPAIASCAALAIYQLQDKRRHNSDLTLIVAALILGLIIDSSWIQLGLISYSMPAPFTNIAPAWIIILWLGFALTINHSLTWLKIHPLLPAAAGLICAPLSYLAGVKFGALKFLDDSVLVYCILGIAWAAALSILVHLSTTKP